MEPFLGHLTAIYGESFLVSVENMDMWLRMCLVLLEWAPGKSGENLCVAIRESEREGDSDRTTISGTKALVEKFVLGWDAQIFLMGRESSGNARNSEN